MLMRSSSIRAHAGFVSKPLRLDMLRAALVTRLRI